MSQRSPRVDRYIAEAPAFAQPILEKLRTTFRKASPQLQENIKWGAPSFEHKGIVGGMAAFKNHVGYGFWKSKLMKDPEGLFGKDACESIMHLSVRKLSELPSQEVLLAYIKEAIELNEQGAKVPRKAIAKKAQVPAPLLAALKKNQKALSVFDTFPPGKRRDYIEWIMEAKREETRGRRIATAVEWIAEGKSRNWKYEK